MITDQCNYGCAAITPNAYCGGTMKHKTATLLSGNEYTDGERLRWSAYIRIGKTGHVSVTYTRAYPSQTYYRENAEKFKQNNHNWRKTNKVRHAARNRQWNADNPEKIRVINGKSLARRKEMGFSPLNAPFDGACGHHVNNDQVIFIPERMHRRYHNLATGQGMAEINALAFRYLFEHT